MLFGIEWNTANEWAFVWSILPILLRGMVVTLEATFFGFFIGGVLGLLLAAAKGAKFRLVAWPAKLISEFFRDTPLLVQLFFLYYVLPEYGIILPAFLTGATALGIQYSAYLSEVYRAGIDAVDYGQIEASRALDITPKRTFNAIIVPQAIPRIIPAMGNYLVSIMKDVPVLSAVSILEMLNAAQIIGDRTFDYFTPLTMVGILYLIMTLIASSIVSLIDKRLPKDGIPMR